LQRSTGARGDQADDFGEFRDRLLAFRIKESLGGKLAFERFEFRQQVSGAREFGFLDDDLKLAARFIDAGLGEDPHFRAILQGIGTLAFAGAKHRALDLRTFVLE